MAKGGAKGSGAAPWREDGATPSLPHVSSLSGSSTSCGEDEPANENRGSKCAWAATTETLVNVIVTVLIIIFEISRITPPIRGGVLGTMPIEQCLLLCEAYAA
jgi:hypothetical protein